MEVQAESFHLNGHIIGFRPQIQKLESPYKTISNILAVKGLFVRKSDALENHQLLCGDDNFVYQRGLFY